VDLGLGIAEAKDAERSLAGAVRALDRLLALTDVLSAAGHGRLVAIARSRDTARVVASG
jgi:hypothetical protein